MQGCASHWRKNDPTLSLLFNKVLSLFCLLPSPIHAMLCSEMDRVSWLVFGQSSFPIGLTVLPYWWHKKGREDLSFWQQGGLQFLFLSDCSLRIMEINGFLSTKIDGEKEPRPKGKISARLIWRLKAKCIQWAQSGETSPEKTGRKPAVFQMCNWMAECYGKQLPKWDKKGLEKVLEHKSSGLDRPKLLTSQNQ